MDNTSAQIDPFDEGADDFDLRQIVAIFLERKWLIFACFSLAVIAGVAYLMLTPPVYRATSLVEVPERRQNAAGFEEQDFRANDALMTIERNLQRISLFRRVAEREDIRTDPAFQGSFEQPLDSLGSLELAEAVAGWANIRLESGTRLIGVSVEHTAPPLAQKIANAIVEEFVSERAEMRSGSSASAAESLVGEAERIGKKLRDSQSILQRLEEAISLREKIDEQMDELAVLTPRYGDAHPSVVQLRNLIEGLNAEFRAKLEQLKPLLPEDTSLVPDRGAIQGASGSSSETNAEFRRLIAYHENLSGEVTTSQALFEAILSKMKETDVTRGLDAASIVVAEEAFLPSKPVKPNKIQIMAASGVFGGGLGIFLVWILHAMHRGLRTVDEAERATGIAVVGAIPSDSRIPPVAWLDKKAKRQITSLIKQSAEEAASGERRKVNKPGKRIPGPIEPLITISDPGSPSSEAFRSLRASLTLMNREQEEKRSTLLVTSSIPGEGKSFVAANLAIAYAAQEGQRTLLIDADLRCPMVDRLFDIDPEGGGLAEALNSGNVRVIASGVGNLDILPAGYGAQRPAELLSGARLADLIGELLKNYDQIIFDSAPVNTVADALLLAPLIDGSLLVARSGKTPKEAVLHARDQLSKAGMPPLGLVLNRLPERSGIASNPYFYYYDGESQKYGSNYR